MPDYNGLAARHGAARRPAAQLIASAAALAAFLGACATRAPTEVAAPAPPPQAAPSETAPVPQPLPARVALREGGSGRYVVKRGDTLWDIAQHFLRDPWQWPELWFVNEQVRNPHRIYPGDVLEIAWVDGHPRLMRDAGLPIERLSPKVREIDLGDAVPAIPLAAIRDFLRGPRIVSLDELERSPYVLAFLDERLLAGAGDEVYVRNLQQSEVYAYTVVEIGEAYHDPETGDLLGYEAIPTAEAEVRDFAASSVAELVDSYRETRIGNRLLVREPELFASNFYPHAPRHPVGGTIISVFDGVSQIGQYRIVALNRGRMHGLEPGHVLSIYQRGRKVEDPVSHERVQLPSQYAGNLMVFKTDERLSYGLVMTAERPLHILDRVDKPRAEER